MKRNKHIPLLILNNTGTNRRHKLISKIKEVAGGEPGSKEAKMKELNKTTYSYTDEKIHKINSSSSVSNAFNANSSYISEKNIKNAGHLSPGLPYNNSKFIKKGKRKTFASAKKKKISSINASGMGNKSISPSLKLKRSKVRSIPFPKTENGKAKKAKGVGESP